VVVAVADERETELAVFYTGEQIPRCDLRETLSGLLPTYLVPQRFRHLESMPLNANGKIDRAAIASLATEG
jgi:acyl-CoA synthetase (AMP-forming)/AMP-acid ligase II